MQKLKILKCDIIVSIKILNATLKNYNIYKKQKLAQKRVIFIKNMFLKKTNVKMSSIILTLLKKSKSAIHPERHSNKPSKIKTKGGIHSKTPVVCDSI